MNINKRDAMSKLERFTLQILDVLVRKKNKNKKSVIKQHHRKLRLIVTVYAFCKRLPQDAFITERALYYHLKSTFPTQRAVTAALQGLTSALNCPRQ